MRRSSSKSVDRKTDSSQTSTTLSLTSTSTERFESPEWELASPGAAYGAEDTRSPVDFHAGLVPAEGHAVSHGGIEADIRRQTTALPPDRESAVGRILPYALECQHGVKDPDEIPAPASGNDSHSCQGKREICPRVRDQDSVNVGPVAPSFSKTWDGTDEAVALPCSSSITNIKPREAGDHRDTHDDVTFSLQTDERTSMRAASPKGQNYSASPFERPEVCTRTAVLRQNVGIIGTETAPTSSKGYDCGERSRPPKRELMSFGWRLRKRGPTKMDTSSTVTSYEGHSTAETSGSASRMRRALTPYSQQAPGEVDTASCALSMTPSPVSTSTGRSSRHSWTSVLTKTAGGRKIPMVSTLFALLRRASSSPPPEKQTPKGPGRLSIASDIEWDCDEPEPEERSLGLPGTPVDSSAGKERKDVHSRDEVDDTSLLQVEEISLTADPHKKRASKLPAFLGLKETPFGGRVGKSLKKMLIASAMILAGMLIVATVLAQSALFQQMTLMRLADDLKMFCTAGAEPASAEGCLAAVERMSHAMDWSADPCSSFDQFVCGHWSRWNQRRRYYKQESMDNLTTRIHESFQHLLRNRNLYGHAEVSMAVFYNSCRWFIARKDERIATAAELMSALGLGHIDMTTDQPVNVPALLNFVVGTSLRSGLSSVISVSSRAGHVYVDVGQSVCSSLGVANVVPFIRGATSDMGLGEDGLNSVLYIEFDVHRAVQKAPSSEPFVNMSAGVLGRRVFGHSLADALNHALPNGVPVHTSDTLVAARCLSQMLAIVHAVVDAKPRTAYFYTSLVLVAQVVKYGYVFPHGASLNDDYVSRTCVKITGSHFKALFPHWVTHTVAGRQGLAEFHAMRQSVRKSFARTATAMELRLNESVLDEISIIVIGERDVSAWPPTAPAGIAPADYDHRFLLNVIRASRDAVDTDYEDRAVDRLLDGDIVIGVVDRRLEVFVPPNFIAPDMTHTSAGPEVNFPTAGVWLMAQWIRAAVLREEISGGALLSRQVPTARPNLDRAVGRSPEHEACIPVTLRSKSSVDRVIDRQNLDLVDVLEDRKECVREEASKVLGRDVFPVEAESLFFVNWALDAAFLAVEDHRLELAPWWWWKDDRRAWQLFIMRFCQTLCGDEVAVDTCRYHALRSKQLAHAFRCDGPPSTVC